MACPTAQGTVAILSHCQFAIIFAFSTANSKGTTVPVRFGLRALCLHCHLNSSKVRPSRKHTRYQRNAFNIQIEREREREGKEMGKSQPTADAVKAAAETAMCLIFLLLFRSHAVSFFLCSYGTADQPIYMALLHSGSH